MSGDKALGCTVARLRGKVNQLEKENAELMALVDELLAAMEESGSNGDTEPAGTRQSIRAQQPDRR